MSKISWNWLLDPVSEIYLMKRENKLLKWVWPRIPGTKRSNNLKWAIILEGNNWASFQEMIWRPDHLLLFIPTRSAKIQRIPVRTTLTLMFRSSHFWFLVFGHFWRRSYKNTKLLHNLCLQFARQYGQNGKNKMKSCN